MAIQSPASPSHSDRQTSSLSFEQEHLWNKRVPNIPPMTVLMLGPLSVNVLREALYLVVKRHETLRTVFQDDPIPTQVILPDPLIDFRFDDFSALPKETRALAANRVILTEATRAFDLYTGPLLRAGLLRLTDNEHIFFFTMHHIIADLWSFRLFFRELGLLYSSCLIGEESPLPQLQMQYADYATWQKKWFQSDVVDAYMTYWQTHLSGMRALQLNPDYSRPHSLAGRGRVEAITISKSTTAGLRTVSRAEKATLFITLLAAFKVLLYQRTGQEDIAISTLVANRSMPGTGSLIGVFANRLMLRTKLVATSEFRELVREVRDVCLGAYAHQEISFWKFAQMTSATQSDLSSTMLFTVQDVPIGLPRFATLQLQPLHLTGPTMFEDVGMAITGRFDQSWEVWKDADELLTTISYPTDLFQPSTIRHMLMDFRFILDQINCNVNITLSDLANRLAVQGRDHSDDHLARVQ